jgi:hypothetical protein
MYGKLARLGYRLGPAFMCIEEIYRGNHEALCRLKRKGRDNKKDPFVLEPGLMDSILQAVLVTSEEYIPLMLDTGKIFIPFSMGSMIRYPARITGTLWCHAGGKYAEGIITGNISVYNEAREICLEITDFTARQTDKKSLLKSMSSTGWGMYLPSARKAIGGIFSKGWAWRIYLP